MNNWKFEGKLKEQVEKNADICFTKPEMAKYLIDRIEFKDNDIVIEPCLGKGAFFNNLPKNVKKIYCEINEGLDYLESETIVDITLSNPPFVPRKLFWSFMLKAMETTRREIYWLINLSSLNVFTQKRLQIMKDKGWYINNLHIVSDKRWFGRYAWMCINKNNNNFYTFSNKGF
jgi:hypothetical protein